MNKKKTEIVRLLKHKQEACALLLLKMEEQVQAVNDKDEPRLNMIVTEKGGLVAGLNETDHKIADLAGGLDKATQESLARENEELGQRIEADLETIIKQETYCQEKLNLVKSEMLEKIKSVKQGQVLLKGYGVNPRIKPKISKNV